jgi:hypothetical protein
LIFRTRISFPSFEWIFVNNPLEGLRFKSSQKSLLSSICSFSEVSLVLVSPCALEVSILPLGVDDSLGAPKVHPMGVAPCNAPNFELNFFFLYRSLNSGVTSLSHFFSLKPYLFPKTPSVIIIIYPKSILFGLLHHAGPCISFACGLNL